MESTEWEENKMDHCIAAGIILARSVMLPQKNEDNITLLTLVFVV